MKKIAPWMGWALLTGLSGCGGGGTSSTPTPTPTPMPSATPSPAATIRNPVTSQSFANDAVTGTAVYDLVTVKTESATQAASSFTIRYESSTRSYTVEAAGRSQTFHPADVDQSTANFTDYEKGSGSVSDYLTIGTNIQSDSYTVPSYVAIGAWQHNELSGSKQKTVFDFLTYGFPTSATAIPRSGTIEYSINAVGVLSVPDQSPKVARGTGFFTADLGKGIFSLNAGMRSFDFLTGDEIYGGGLQLRGGGYLSSGDGSFSGNLSYQYLNGLVAGTLTGRFYGPTAQEVGAAFRADNADGGALLGAFSGTTAGSNPATTLTLDALRRESLFGTLGASARGTRGIDDRYYLSTGLPLTGQLTLSPDGSLKLPGLTSDMHQLVASATDQVASPDPNFIRYRKLVSFPGFSPGPQDMTLDLFKAGNANTQLALTYLSFGIWDAREEGVPPERLLRSYFVYGIETPYGLLARRTGSAQYQGLIRGAGLNAVTAERYELSGTSQFDINFGTHSFNGSLAIRGDVVGTSRQRDFGNFAFTGSLNSAGQFDPASLLQAERYYGRIESRFYGPDGEEIGSAFTINYGRIDDLSDLTSLVGISVAKRQ